MTDHRISVTLLRNEVALLGIKVTIVEPGAFRTDWGGSSMRIPPVGPGYEQTVGRMNAYRLDVDGTQPGDPERAATAIMSLVDAAEPPVRLVLGSDALAAARRASVARAEEADAWASVSESTDFTAP